MLINTTSLSIILRHYKEGNLSEDEAIQLINDIKDNSYFECPEITYDSIPKYEITC